MIVCPLLAGLCHKILVNVTAIIRNLLAGFYHKTTPVTCQWYNGLYQLVCVTKMVLYWLAYVTKQHLLRVSGVAFINLSVLQKWYLSHSDSLSFTDWLICH